MDPFLIKAFDVSLCEQTVICKPLSFCLCHPRSEHQERPKNNNHEENNETGNLEPKGLQSFTAKQHSICNNARQNRALCKKDWCICVGTLPYETQSRTPIRMRRYEIQLNPINLPEKAKPDHESHVPTQ